MIYRNIEKLVLNTPNNMELGEKIRELYWKERDFEDAVGQDSLTGFNEFEKLVDGLLGIDESNTIDKRTTIKGSYRDELPPSDYQLDN
tara:strand:- start:512 stop:775 length:264 start_codon:yes stop_codon:yes gene_type:complete